jgi:hypothetical protein
MREMARVATLFGEWEEPDPKPVPPWGEEAEEHHYILDENRQPIPVLEEEWAAWSRSHHVRRGHVATSVLGNGYEVITSFDGSVQADEDRDGAPLLFHTLVIMPMPDDLYVDAYPTREAAEAGHRKWVQHYGERVAERAEA